MSLHVIAVNDVAAVAGAVARAVHNIRHHRPDALESVHDGAAAAAQVPHQPLLSKDKGAAETTGDMGDTTKPMLFDLSVLLWQRSIFTQNAIFSKLY